MKIRSLVLLLSYGCMLLMLQLKGIAQQQRGISPDSAYKVVQLEQEKALSIFKPNRDFHVSLRYETAGLTSYPYDRLDSLFLQMKALTDSAIVYKSRTDSIYSKQPDIWDRECSYWMKLMKDNRSQVKELSNLYQSTVASASIVRTSNPRMIELMGKRVKQWQDSLTLQGRLLGEAKMDLKQRFPESSGDRYLKTYAPISEMEAGHKRFQALLLQLENMQSRFEEMNNEVVYFSGPGISPKQEVVIVDQLLGQFILEMKTFRDWRGRYYQQFK